MDTCPWQPHTGASSQTRRQDKSRRVHVHGKGYGSRMNDHVPSDKIGLGSGTLKNHHTNPGKEYENADIQQCVN